MYSRSSDREYKYLKRLMYMPKWTKYQVNAAKISIFHEICVLDNKCIKQKKKTQVSNFVRLQIQIVTIRKSFLYPLFFDSHLQTYLPHPSYQLRLRPQFWNYIHCESSLRTANLFWTNVKKVKTGNIDFLLLFFPPRLVYEEEISFHQSINLHHYYDDKWLIIFQFSIIIIICTLA